MYMYYQHFKLRVSDPGTAAYVDLKSLFNSSRLPGSGPAFPD